MNNFTSSCRSLAANIAKTSRWLCLTASLLTSFATIAQETVSIDFRTGLSSISVEAGYWTNGRNEYPQGYFYKDGNYVSYQYYSGWGVAGYWLSRSFSNHMTITSSSRNIINSVMYSFPQRETPTISKSTGFQYQSSSQYMEIELNNVVVSNDVMVNYSGSGNFIIYFVDDSGNEKEQITLNGSTTISGLSKEYSKFRIKSTRSGYLYSITISGLNPPGTIKPSELSDYPKLSVASSVLCSQGYYSANFTLSNILNLSKATYWHLYRLTEGTPNENLTTNNLSPKSVASSSVGYRSSFDFTINNISAGTYYVVLSDNRDNPYAEGAYSIRSNDVRLFSEGVEVYSQKNQGVAELTYMYDAKRIADNRSYTDKDIRPLIRISNCSTVTWTVSATINKTGSSTHSMTNTDWVTEYPSNSSTILVANYAKLRDAIWGEGYCVLETGKEPTDEDGCTTALHPGDYIEITIKLSTGRTYIIRIRITDKYSIAYIVRGPLEGNFFDTYEYDIDSSLNGGDELFESLKEDIRYEVTAVNAFAPFNIMNYMPYDLVLLTDYPRVTGTSYPDRWDYGHPEYIDPLQQIVGIKPFFSLKSFLADASCPRWNNFGFVGEPVAPRASEEIPTYDLDKYKNEVINLDILCAHTIFDYTDFGDLNESDNSVTVNILKEPSDDQHKKGLQGFREMLPNFVNIGIIDPTLDKTKQKDTLICCMEWQEEVDARFMVLSINMNAMPNLTTDGKTTISALLQYLLDANPAHVEDCAFLFDNGYEYEYTQDLENYEKITEYMERMGYTDRNQYIADHVTFVSEEEGYRVRSERANYKEVLDNINQSLDDEQPKFVSHDTIWSNPANWIQRRLPQRFNAARIHADCYIAGATHEVTSMRINERVGKLVIRPTGGLKVSGHFWQFDGIDDYNNLGPILNDTLIVIKSDEKNTGMLVHQHLKTELDEAGKNRPLFATVELYSGAQYMGTQNDMQDTIEAKKEWTYFGMPVMEGKVPEVFFGAYTYEWHEEKGRWDRMGDGKVLKSWGGYALSQPKPETFILKGQLEWVTTTDIPLTYTESGGQGANMRGYPWTAPLHIDRMKESDFVNAEAVIYLYNTGRNEGLEGEVTEAASDGEPGTWFGIPINLSDLNDWKSRHDNIPAVIPAMNAFMVYANPGGGSVHIDYNKMVYNPAGENRSLDNAPRHAPKKNNTTNDDVQLMHLSITDSQIETHSDVYLVQGKNFNEGFDNGWEAWFMGGNTQDFWIYTPIGDMSIAAVPDIDGTTLGFVPSVSKQYTFTFSWSGKQLWLNDSKEEYSTLIAEGQSYTFLASTDDQPNRFFISSKPYENHTATSVTDFVRTDGSMTISNPKAELLTVSIYDIQGRLHSAYNTTDTMITITLPEAQGVYLITARGETTNIVRKLTR